MFATLAAIGGAVGGAVLGMLGTMLAGERTALHAREAAHRASTANNNGNAKRNARTNARAEFAKKAEAFNKRDQAESFNPFLRDAPLFKVMKQRLEKGIKHNRPGTIVVLAPKEAGKTTRAIEVGQALKQAGIICDFAVADLLEVGDKEPFSFVKMELGGEDAGKVKIQDIIPEAASAAKPALIIVDNTEGLRSRLDDAEELSFKLCKSSVDCGGRFYVLALCSDLNVAEKMLSANGGEKVRPLDEGDKLEEGCRLQPDQCRTLLEDALDIHDIKLNDDDLTKAIACVTKGGVPGIVRNFVNKLDDGKDIASSLDSLRKASDKTDQDWKENHSFGKTGYPLDPSPGKTGYVQQTIPVSASSSE